MSPPTLGDVGLLLASALLGGSAVSLSTAGGGASPPCLHFAPETTEVRGRLLRLSLPVPTSGGGAASAGSTESGYYLRLEEPACFTPMAVTPEPGTTAADTLLQLSLDASNETFLRPLLGKILIVRGRASPGRSGRDHAPVVVLVDSAWPALEN